MDRRTPRSEELKMHAPQALYLDLLKKSLTFLLWPEPPRPISLFFPRPWYRQILAAASLWCAKRLGLQLARVTKTTEAAREGGRTWPVYAHTMVGLHRLDSLQACIEAVLRDEVPGDLIETGVWRGGASIFMRGVLASADVTDRKVYVADSFRGLPAPKPGLHAADHRDEHHRMKYLAVSQDEVRANFERYGLLDEQVVFLEGWFSDTLPAAPIAKLAILRLDGDMYESTIDALNSLYPKLSPGGYCIIDDYLLRGCRAAVDDYRRDHAITESIEDIDGMAALWRKDGATVHTNGPLSDIGLRTDTQHRRNPI